LTPISVDWLISISRGSTFKKIVLLNKHPVRFQDSTRSIVVYTDEPDEDDVMR